jgi:hypothetical protein
MIFKSYLQTINEEFLGFTNDILKKIVEIHKNPKSIKQFGKHTKGVIGIKGDLYIADEGFNLVHRHIKKYLCENHPKENIILDDYKKQIHVIRYDKTFTFYLSEIYSANDIDNNKDYFIEQFKICKSKNPELIFVLTGHYHGSDNDYNSKADLNKKKAQEKAEAKVKANKDIKPDEDDQEDELKHKLSEPKKEELIFV